MHIPNLIIEVTRRCSLRCAHCLRGDAQDVDIKWKYIDELLQGTTSIGTVTFSGGEPLLSPDVITYFTRKCKSMDITVDSFYIATNGTVTQKSTPKAVQALVSITELWAYCDDREGCSIDISKDKWHKDEVQLNYNNLLEMYSFCHTRGENATEQFLISAGRASDNGWGSPIKGNYLNYDYPDEFQIYLSAYGGVTYCCDMSYDYIDEKAVTIIEAHKVIKEMNNLSENYYTEGTEYEA